MTLISYASNFEDVLLNRVFSSVNNGFYIDIGADHPVFSSTTKLFYDRGWSGINVEPGSSFGLLSAQRKRDKNIQAAVTDFDGEIDFYVNDDLNAISSIFKEMEPSIEKLTKNRSHITVPAVKLDTLIKEHALNIEVDFLKIDAEGAEESIILSTNWKEFRPTIILAESTKPFSTERIDSTWKKHLESNKYQEAYFDGINTWFVRNENKELLDYFLVPVNVLDDFEKYNPRIHDPQFKSETTTANSFSKKLSKKLRKIVK